MKHVNGLSHDSLGGSKKNLLVRATGRFYTHPFIVEQLAHTLVRSIYFNGFKEFRIVDPFCGDGRLIIGVIKEAAKLLDVTRFRWFISAWDCDPAAIKQTKAALQAVVREMRLKANLDVKCQDTFLSSDLKVAYDCVITNPPWEALKPDRRELSHMSKAQQDIYTAGIREYDQKLATRLPFSQPDRKFAGWGTNLSRCGLELALKLLKDNAYCGIVLPASVLTDQTSVGLRKWAFKTATPTTVAHFPAEARLFQGVDQASVAAVFKRFVTTSYGTTIVRYDKQLQVIDKDDFPLSQRSLEALDYGIPLESGATLLKCMKRWERLPRFGDIEGKGPKALWAGRELDETNHKRFLASSGRVRFLKGRMVDRYRIAIEPSQFVNETLQEVPSSAFRPRLAWRDVARRSRGRRMQVTYIGPSIVTGNSLSVAYFKDDNEARLLALVAIMNSIPFEFQIRTRSATGHISLGLVRKAFIPDLSSGTLIKSLSKFVKKAAQNPSEAIEAAIEVRVALAFGLSREDYAEILSHFSGITSEFKAHVLESRDWTELNDLCPVTRQPARAATRHLPTPARIPNHYSSKLSANDLKMALAVPPGGNWKNIPLSVESQRLENIRKSYAAGEGSRSTYYGRLRAEHPAYTINTYFNRPGNGCHLHYDFEGGQHRVLSEREAARIQSFPDSFVFCGPHTAILKQIGNAVPPLLGYQIARAIPVKGHFVDLFSGAGGLSLGFKWAGWTPIIANDIESPFLDTYRHNVHDSAICGDIRSSEVFNAIVQKVRDAKIPKSSPLFVLGGPPCQGFSTAGKRRTMEDHRNQLFYEYKRMLAALDVSGFIFENVTGLLNMDGGAVFELVKRELGACANKLEAWKMQAENYGVPQRRTMVVLLGHSLGENAVTPPQPLTSMAAAEPSLFGQLVPAISVREALGDLPPLVPGEDGSQKDYLYPSRTPYQALMRGELTPEKYLAQLAKAIEIKGPLFADVTV